jgi:membrane protease YdiL (CAAX protease family)
VSTELPVAPPPPFTPPRPDMAVELPPSPPPRSTWDPRLPPDELPPPATWGVLEMIPVFLMPYGVVALASIYLTQIVSYRHPAVYIFIALLQGAAAGLAVLFWVKYINHGPMTALGLPPRHRVGRDVAVGLALGVAMFVIAILVGAFVRDVLSAILGHPPTYPNRFPSRIDGLWFALFAPVLVVSAPFGEELLFRGFIFKGLRRRLSLWPAVLLSAGVFALVHLYPLIMPTIFADGVVLALAYERRQSLATTMVMHAVNNLIIFAILLPGALR